MTIGYFSVGGTAQAGPYDPGQFPNQVAQLLVPTGEQIFADKLDGIATNPLIDWRAIDYPAAVFPMGPSVQEGRQNLVQAIQSRPGPLVLSGYSQGAMVVDTVWCFDFLSPAGVLHNRIDDVKAIINFGDPMRCPGIAHGNELVGIPMPTHLDGYLTGGIAGPACLTPEQTPSFLYSIALDGDLYACAPIGTDPWTAEADVGMVETGIFNIVQQPTFWNVVEVANDLKVPLATVEAIINGLVFAAQGPAAPHWQYGPYVPAAARFIASLAEDYA